jgi:hypothetical protein
MKRILLVSILLILISLSLGDAYAQHPTGVSANTGDGYFDLPVCLPDMPDDGSCLMYGPAQVIAEMKASGFTYPPRELPAATPPSELGVMPVLIARINIPEEAPAPLFASFNDAVTETNPIGYKEPGALRYVSYIARQDHNGKPYVQLATGEWIRAAPAAYTKFQGLEFFENPRNDFGWIVSYDQNESFREPSYPAQGTGRFYTRADIIQVYETLEIDGLTWFKIGPEEWVNSWMARVVSVSPTRPEGVNSDRWIEINLEQQIILAYEDGRLLFATLIATGVKPFYTQPGVFQIYEKKELETMQGSFEADRSDFYYLQDVPWTMYYDQKRAIHATYWPFGFGAPQSHGCVNLSPGDARWLFEWAEEGDYVWVHDPSGQTPTDPNYYGQGAP